MVRWRNFSENMSFIGGEMILTCCGLPQSDDWAVIIECLTNWCINIADDWPINNTRLNGEGPSRERDM
jgi:hypothetical protein